MGSQIEIVGHWIPQSIDSKPVNSQSPDIWELYLSVFIPKGHYFISISEDPSDTRFNFETKSNGLIVRIHPDIFFIHHNQANLTGSWHPLFVDEGGSPKPLIIRNRDIAGKGVRRKSKEQKIRFMWSEEGLSSHHHSEDWHLFEHGNGPSSQPFRARWTHPPGSSEVHYPDPPT